MVTDLQTAGEVRWILPDNQGIARDIVDNAGNVLNHRVFSAFGETLSESNAAVDSIFGAFGRETDAESELQFNRNRYYDPANGRWISPDPLGFAAGDENLNRYVGNSPANLTDPFGLHDVSDAGSASSSKGTDQGSGPNLYWHYMTCDDNFVSGAGGRLLEILNEFNPVTIVEQGAAVLDARTWEQDIASAKNLATHPLDHLEGRADAIYDGAATIAADRLTTPSGLGATFVDAAAVAITHKVGPIGQPRSLAPSLPTGARGPVSRRWFNLRKAGGPIRELTVDKIKITDRGIDVVEHHVARFGPDKPNSIMIERLRQIARCELEATTVDKNFYAHELREFVRYRRRGHPTGMGDSRRIWNNAHTATLEDYRLQGKLEDLFHKDAIEGL